MGKPTLNLISKPGSTESHLFEEGTDSPESKVKKQDKDKEKDEFAPRRPEEIKIPGQIAGRVPTSTGAFGLINGVEANLGAGMRVAVFKGLKDIGLGFIETLYDNAGGDFDGPWGSSIGLKYKEKSYDLGNRYIREDEVRKAVDDKFRRDGNEIVWIESEGISEIGGGTGGTLPLGNLADASANFKLSGLLRYRRLEPYESASGTLLPGQSLINAANVPLRATLARRMPPGGEFEITAEGLISLEPEIAESLGYDTESVKMGASLHVGGKVQVKGETTISVQRLPFGDEVLVKIAHGKSGNADAGASFKAGVEMEEETYEQLPELGRGLLKFLLDRLGLPDVPEFVKRYLQSQVKIKARYEKRATEIARYVFDLSKPAARAAYEEIFTKLSLGKTKDLVSKNDSCVRSQKAGEKVTVSEKGFAATLGKAKLLLMSALDAEREGNVSLDGRANVTYRDSKFEKVYSNWFTGEQKIKWEAVCVDKGDKSKQNYFHLTFSNNDRITEEHEIEQFMRFCRSLGIKTQVATDECEIAPEQVAKVLSDRDDTETRASIYFTDEGIKRIGAASPEECKKAYLEADAQLKKSEKLVETPVLQRYQEISNMWFFKRIFYWGEMSRLKDEYAKQSVGRNIVSDTKSLNEAQTFSDTVRKMAQNDEKATRSFFINLAKQSGFAFMNKISALMSLATAAETIIHELSLAGGGLTIGAQDEGEILHPERAMNRMLTKIA